MATVIEHRKYSKTDIDVNNNKYWFIWLYDDGGVETQNGRQGSMGQRRFITGTGRRTFERKLKEKERKGYIENKTADAQSPDEAVSTVANSKLQDIARKQIQSTNPLTQKLIDYFVSVNAHQIFSATGGKIVFDTSTAQFKTTVGVIVPTQITRARNLLDALADMVSNRDWDNVDFKPKLNEYLSLIPRNFGLRKVTSHDILPNLQKVQDENTILDGLDASFAGLVQVNDTGQKDKEDAPKIFDVQLKFVEDTKVINKLSKLFKSTIKHGHVTRSYKIKTVYEVSIVNMKKAFNIHGKKLTNIRQLWHGTKASNVLSILRQGLIIPPSHSSHCTGRMYGNGLYFSSISTKALNYATNFWGGGGNIKRVFMFLADVAMGKYYLASSGWSNSFPKQGYDSTWAKGGSSGVINDEMIIYKLKQANLVYLIEFEDTGRNY